MIYLLKKTHNVTGLKYLCKHETSDKADCFKYAGSGTYWRRHLNIHGQDISTKILLATNDKKLFKKVALEYSEKWNIIESKEWANLCVEEGQGGKTISSKKSREYSIKIHNNFSKEEKQRRKNWLLKANIGRKKSKEHKKAISNSLKGKLINENNPNAKCIETPFGIFKTIKDAQKKLNLTYAQIHYKIETNKIGWKYKE